MFNYFHIKYNYYFLFPMYLIFDNFLTFTTINNHIHNISTHFLISVQ